MTWTLHSYKKWRTQTSTFSGVTKSTIILTPQRRNSDNQQSGRELIRNQALANGKRDVSVLEQYLNLKHIRAVRCRKPCRAREMFYNMDIIDLMPHTPTEMIMTGDFNCVISTLDCTGFANIAQHYSGYFRALVSSTCGKQQTTGKCLLIAQSLKQPDAFRLAYNMEEHNISTDNGHGQSRVVQGYTWHSPNEWEAALDPYVLHCML